jgi:hypothetical protein
LHYLAPVQPEQGARPAADHVPPQDTFHRWAYYTEVNYEELRTVTEALYPERPDLDMAMALWESYEGAPEEVDAAFEKHCQRYAEEAPSSLKALEFGQWSLLADFKKNREKIQFFNKNTEVLKRILDRHAEDKKLGADLMRNRVRQTKAKNIAEEGPDDPALVQYKTGQLAKGQGFAGQGVEQVISQEEMLRLEKARGNIKAAKDLEVLEQYEKTIARLGEKETSGQALSDLEVQELAVARTHVARAREMAAVPDDAIQVDVFTNDPVSGTFGKSHFYSRAEAPEHLAREDHSREPGHPIVRASLSQQEEAAIEAAGSTGVTTRDTETARPSPALASTKWDPNEVPAFAPYAVQHILESETRTADEMHAEALRDSTIAATQNGS